MAQRSSDEQEKSANDTRTKAEELESSQHPERKSKPPGKKQDLFLEYFSKFRDAQEETKDNKPLKKDDIPRILKSVDQDFVACCKFLSSAKYEC